MAKALSVLQKDGRADVFPGAAHDETGVKFRESSAS